jgi:nitrate reductase gamma subunit
VVLVFAIVAGLATTALGSGIGAEDDYRETDPPWFRSLFVFQRDIWAMAGAAPSFQVYALIGRLLFASWPFTRLVHAFTARWDTCSAPTSSTAPSRYGRREPGSGWRYIGS